MTLILPRSTRRSRLLYEFSTPYVLDRSEQILDALSLQVGTYARPSAATFVDSNGRLGYVGHSQPRFEWANDPNTGLNSPGLLLEGSRTNNALWCRDLTNAAWTNTLCTAALNRTGVDGAALSATTLTATGVNGTSLQAITLASGARFFSAYVRRITGSGPINMTLNNGVTWVPLTLTTAWQRLSIPTITLANPTVGFQITTNADAIAVDFAQLEDGPFQSSAILTTTATVTRAADAFSHAFNLLPQALSIYMKYRMIAQPTPLAYALAIGSDAAGTSPCILFLTDATNSIARLNIGGANDAVIGPIPSVGDTVELLAQLVLTGTTATINILRSLNANAAVAGTTSAAAVLPSTWGSATLRYGLTGSEAYVAMQSMRLTAGLQTLAYMRAN